MSDTTPKDPSEPTASSPRSRPWWRPGPRAMIELAVIVASAVGLVVMRDRNEFPKPLIRDLRSGSAAEKIEALRSLSLFSEAGEKAIPALLETLRDDPDPTVRQASVFVLAALVAADEGVQVFPFAELLAGSTSRIVDPMVVDEGERSLPKPHSRVAEVVGGLVRSTREDRDPAVRAEAVAAITTLLDSSLGFGPQPERTFDSEPSDLPAPEPAFAVEPWMQSAALALAELAGSEDRSESLKAVSWASVDRAARVLLDEDQRNEALLRGGVRAAKSPATSAEFWVIRAAAFAVRDDPKRRPVFLDAMARIIGAHRSEGQGNSGTPPDPVAGLYDSRNPKADLDQFAVPFWMAGPSASELTERPDAIDAMIRLLERSPPNAGFTSEQPGHAASPIEVQLALEALEAERRLIARNSRFAGWIVPAIENDPTILDVLGDRLDAVGWQRVLGVMGSRVPEALSREATVSTGLPPERAERAAGHLAEAIESYSRTRPRSIDRAPGLLAYFVRGIRPGSEARQRFEAVVERISNLRIEDDPVPFLGFGEFIP